MWAGSAGVRGGRDSSPTPALPKSYGLREGACMDSYCEGKRRAIRPIVSLRWPDLAPAAGRGDRVDLGQLRGGERRQQSGLDVVTELGGIAGAGDDRGHRRV